MSSQVQPIIAIDGPAGAGKSTLARMVARELHITYVDTGAMYRAATLLALEHQALEDENELSQVLQQVPIILDDHQRVYLADRDVTSQLRSREVTANVSKISSWPSVRDLLVANQRRIAERGGVVMDGRDIGTNVFPDADVKIFLSASLRERAHRRQEQDRDPRPLEVIEEEVSQRDLLDASRTHAPLRQAPDAILLETDGLNLEQSLAAVMHIIESTLNRD